LAHSLSLLMLDFDIAKISMETKKTPEAIYAQKMILEDVLLKIIKIMFFLWAAFYLSGQFQIIG
jgi:hypothetical protein